MVRGFIKSILAHGKAIQLIIKLRLWLYLFVSGAACLMIAFFVFFAIYLFADDFGEWITSWYKWRGEGVVEKIGTFLSGASMLLLVFIVFKHLVIITVSPFMSHLSELIENYLKDTVDSKVFTLKQSISDILRSARLAIRNLFWELLFTVILLLIGFILPILSPIFVVLIFIIQAYYAGFGNMDFTMERHLNYRESIQLVRRNRGIAIGNGVIFLGLLVTGIGFLFAPVFATIAGTIETHHIIKNDRPLLTDDDY